MKKKKTPELVEIEVSFEHKELARKANITFNRETRAWYGATDSIELFQKLVDEKIKETQEKKEAENEVEEENLTKKEEGTPFMFLPYIDPYAPETSKEFGKNLELEPEKETWDSVLERKNTLEIAYKIQQYGMPKTVENRILIFKILGRTIEGQYSITYDGLMNACEDFRNRYPEEYVQNLIQNCITGQRFYIDEIRDSHLSEEEKQLLYFILPLK